MQITFFAHSMHENLQNLASGIRSYVKTLPESDFDGTDKTQLAELVAAKFRFPEMGDFATGPIERDEPVFTQGSDQVTIKVYIPYSGEVTAFGLKGSSSPLPPPTFQYDDKTLQKTYRLDKRHIERLDDEVQRDIDLVNRYLKPVKDMIPKYNQSLLETAGEAIERRLHEINQNKQAVNKLSTSKFTVRKREDGAEKVIVPVKRKPISVPQQSGTTDAVREYVLSMNEYDDILKTISSMVKVMEHTPSVFAEMNEEPLRTILLVALNGIYEGDATGETFNGHGKTDVLIRRGDRNVFIAECLMWKGQSYLLKKMDDQLFQYAMWRDSKLALIVFNRGGNFSKAIETMKITVNAHPQCVKQVDWSHESGARYLFKRHDDPGRNFMLTALAFDVPSDAQSIDASK